MRMQRMGWCGVAAVMVLLFMAVPGRGEEIALPKGVAVHVRTAPMEQTLVDLDAFVATLLRGTPVQAFVPPGMIRTQLVEAIGIPLETFDLTKGMHILFVINPEDYDDVELVLLFPVEDFAATLARLGDFGMKVEELDGGYQIRIGFNTVFVSDTGKGYAMVVEDGETLALGQATLADWTPPANLEGAHLEFAYSMEHLYEAGLGEKFREVVEEALQELEELEFEQLDITTMVKPTLDILLAIGEQIKDARFRLHLSPERITMTCDVTARPGTPLAEFYNLHEKSALPMDSYALLPAEAHVTGVVAKQPAAVEWIRPRMRAYLVDTFSPLDAEAAVALGAMYDAFLEHGGDTAMASTMVESGAVSKVTLIRSENPEAARAAYGGLHEVADAFVNSIISLIREIAEEDIPVTLRIAYNKEAGTLEGVTHDAIKVDLTFEDKLLAEMGEHERKFFLEQMETMKTNIEGLLADVDGTFVVVEGEKAEETLTAMIQALRNKTVRLGANEKLVQAVNRHAEAGGTAVFTMDLIPLIKVGATDSINKLSLVDENAANAMRMMLRALQGKGEPFVLAARQGTKDSTHLTIEMPVGEINTLITTIAQMATTWMMMAPQMQFRVDEDFGVDGPFDMEVDDEPLQLL